MTRSIANNNMSHSRCIYKFDYSFIYEDRQARPNGDDKGKTKLSSKKKTDLLRKTKQLNHVQPSSYPGGKKPVQDQKIKLGTVSKIKPTDESAESMILQWIGFFIPNPLQAQ